MQMETHETLKIEKDCICCIAILQQNVQLFTVQIYLSKLTHDFKDRL